MLVRELHQCQCPRCQQPEPHPDQELHAQHEPPAQPPRRAATPLVRRPRIQRIGHGGDTLLALVTGLHVDTIRRGREELADGLQGRPADRVRLPGGGRPPVKKKIPPSSPT